MSAEDPDISMLRHSDPVRPERCQSCNSLIDPHNGECRCSA